MTRDQARKMVAKLQTAGWTVIWWGYETGMDNFYTITALTPDGATKVKGLFVEDFDKLLSEKES